MGKTVLPYVRGYMGCEVVRPKAKRGPICPPPGLVEFFMNPKSIPAGTRMPEKKADLPAVGLALLEAMKEAGREHGVYSFFE